MPLYTRKNSLRLKGYDYSQSGAYFVTILAYKRLHLFGSIAENATVSLTKLGNYAENCWQQIPQHFASVELDVSIIMPNHIHGILVLHDQAEHAPSLSVVINTFKGAVTRLARKEAPSIELGSPIWHRGFHDHIIRSDYEYNHIAQYVVTNPQRWNADSLNT
ncbi:MAG: transposase [Anaerolineae bacterium]|nr:transposase [Anaerolineae bacterium]